MSKDTINPCGYYYEITLARYYYLHLIITTQASSFTELGRFYIKGFPLCTRSFLTSPSWLPLHHAAIISMNFVVNIYWKFPTFIIYTISLFFYKIVKFFTTIFFKIFKKIWIKSNMALLHAI